MKKYLYLTNFSFIINNVNLLKSKKAKERRGRPKMSEADKIKYQRIAVTPEDYKKLVEKLEKRGNMRLIDAFTEMVDNFSEREPDPEPEQEHDEDYPS